MVYNLIFKENTNMTYKNAVVLFDFKDKIKYFVALELKLDTDKVRLDFINNSFKDAVKYLLDKNEITENMKEIYKWFKENTDIEVEDHSNVLSPLYYSITWDELDRELDFYNL